MPIAPHSIKYRWRLVYIGHRVLWLITSQPQSAVEGQSGTYRPSVKRPLERLWWRGPMGSLGGSIWPVFEALRWRKLAALWGRYALGPSSSAGWNWGKFCDERSLHNATKSKYVLLAKGRVLPFRNRRDWSCFCRWQVHGNPSFSASFAALAGTLLHLSQDIQGQLA